MRTFVRGFLAVVLLTSITIAQSSSKTGAPRRTNVKVVVISGEVSDDGTTFVSNEINKWTVTNAASLKGYEGAYITVKCRVDPDKHAMQVLSIAPQEVVKYNAGDSAFRR